MATISSTSLRLNLLTQYSEARAETDRLFKILDPTVVYERPIPERNRIVFYIGHLEAFDWNLLRENIGVRSFNPEFDYLFAFGIDPVDGGLPSDVASDWPSIGELNSYRNQIRSALDSALSNALDEDGLVQLMNIAIEHRLMHAETLEYMFHQLPFDRKIPPVPLSERRIGAVSPGMLPIPAGQVTLGLKRDQNVFGWDNEFEEHTAQVPSFSIDKYKVTNGQFLDFLNVGGYSNQNLWTEADWKWRSEGGISQPVFWTRNRDGWNYRTMFEEIPLPLNSPVFVSQAEASAYARWSGKELPTEAEWHRAAYGTGSDHERQYPWGSDAPKDARTLWDPPPIGSKADQVSFFGVEGLVGSGWEWTATQFEPFPGFKTVPEYPGYSANFFDGKHYVMKGGSTRTAACMLRRSFRNWFQPHYQYVYAGFRCVSR